MILVTGGCGYIGSHLVKKLSKQGRNVVVIDNLSTSSKEPLTKYAKVVEGDFANLNLLDKATKKQKPQALFHFAASISVPESIKKPKKYLKNNYHKSKQLWQFAVENNIPAVIFSSTAAVYGKSKEAELKETTPPKPLNPYGKSKLKAEKTLKDITKESQTKYVILRYFNVAGSEKDYELGPSLKNSHHLIKNCLDAASGKKDKLDIYGNNYNTPDGTCIRDFVHIRDLINAHIKAMKHLQQGRKSITLNIGSGKGYSVLEVIEAVEEVTGKKIPTKTTKRRKGDPAKVIADIARVKKTLQWEPKHSDIKEMVKDSWKWYQKYYEKN